MDITQIDFHLLNIPNLSKRVGRRALPWKYAQFRMSCVVYLLLFSSVKKSRNEVLVCVFQFREIEDLTKLCVCVTAINVVYADASVAGSFK